MSDNEAAWLAVPPVVIELSADLAALGKDLERDVAEAREALFLELGVRFPRPVLRPRPTLKSGEYQIQLHEVPTPVAKAGANASKAIAQHLAALFRQHARAFVRMQLVQQMLDALKFEHPALVAEVVPQLVSLRQLTEILGRLVEESVSIRDLPAILQALGEIWRPGAEAFVLTEEVRCSMRRYLSHKLSQPGDSLPVYLLDPRIEQRIREAIRKSPAGYHLELDPGSAIEIVAALRAQESERPPDSPRPVILTTGDIRRFVRRMLEIEFNPPFAVVCYQELEPNLDIKPVARISIPAT
jgi:type III secretion protein V